MRMRWLSLQWRLERKCLRVQHINWRVHRRWGQDLFRTWRVRVRSLRVQRRRERQTFRKALWKVPDLSQPLRWVEGLRRVLSVQEGAVGWQEWMSQQLLSPHAYSDSSRDCHSWVDLRIRTQNGGNYLVFRLQLTRTRTNSLAFSTTRTTAGISSSTTKPPTLVRTKTNRKSMLPPRRTLNVHRRSSFSASFSVSSPPLSS